MRGISGIAWLTLRRRAGCSDSCTHPIRSIAILCWPDKMAIMRALRPLRSTESMLFIVSSESSHASRGPASPFLIASATCSGSGGRPSPGTRTPMGRGVRSRRLCCSDWQGSQRVPTVRPRHLVIAQPFETEYRTHDAHENNHEHMSCFSFSPGGCVLFWNLLAEIYSERGTRDPQRPAERKKRFPVPSEIGGPISLKKSKKKCDHLR